MKIEDITAKRLKDMSDEHLSHLRSRFINIFNRYFEGSDMQKAVNIDRRVFLIKYKILRSEMDIRKIKFFRETPIDKEAYNRIFKWEPKVLKSRRNSINEIIKRLWSYIKLLLKKLIIWLSLAFFIIVVIFEFVLDIEEIPSYLFWILAIVIFLWANFQIYKKLHIDYEELEKNHKELEKYHKELEKNYEEFKKNYEILEKKIPRKDRELIIKSELSIMLLEGNEYTYSLLNRATFIKRKIGVDYILPDSSIELHFRILNTGTIDLDIISIGSKYDDIYLHWSFSPLSIPKEKKKELLFPRHLGVEEVLLCDLDSLIYVNAGLNEAQFAARFVEIDKESKGIECNVNIEARDSKGDIHKFSHKFEVALRPLMDLYINIWQGKNQTDLLRLARSETKTKKSIKSKGKAAQKNKSSSM